MVGVTEVSTKQVEYMLWQQAHMYPIGTTIIYNSIDLAGNVNRVKLVNRSGIDEMLHTICEKNLYDACRIYTDNGTKAFECIFTYDLNNMTDMNIMSFANMCATTGGYHVNGFVDAIIKFMRDYMNKVFLVNNKKLQISAQDIRTGLRAVVSCKSLHPLFEGQAKTEYAEKDMYNYAYTATYSAIDSWAKKFPNDLQKLCKYLKEVCEARTKLDDEKIKIRDKYVSNALSGGLPAKYKPANGRGPFEAIICEGDSALGGIINNRDKFRQAVFPIRGKIKNCFTCTPSAFFDNAEIAGMFSIFGYNSYQKHFDPDLFKPEKVIIATDADPDGSHIESLLLMMFLKYLPFAIEQGKIYAANPPLYGFPTSKGKMKFFADNLEYIEWVRGVFCRDNKISDLSGRELSKQAILKLLYDNIDYLKLITTVSSIYSIDPIFLEFLLYNRELPFNKFKSTVEKAYKYTKVSVENGVTMIRGLVGNAYHTVFFNERLILECQDIIDLISKHDKYYLLNGQKVTIYSIMSAFANAEPNNITRYKGLGEFNLAA